MSLVYFIQGDMVSVPDTGSPQLQCVGEFLDAVTELEDDDVSLLRLCSENNARLLCKVVSVNFIMANSFNLFSPGEDSSRVESRVERWSRGNSLVY